MNTGYYTGIGSRDTPLDEKRLMTELAMHFQNWGYTLRTGSVSAADRAFETGAGSAKEVYVPWDGWNDQRGISSVSPESMSLAKIIWKCRKKGIQEGIISESACVSDEWDAVHPATKIILAKTMCMVLGKNLKRPSDALICWTPGGKIVGLSAHPIVLATISRIPVFNLADPETEDVMRTMLRENRNPSNTIENRRERCVKELATFGNLLE